MCTILIELIWIASFSHLFDLAKLGVHKESLCERNVVPPPLGNGAPEMRTAVGELVVGPRGFCLANFYNCTKYPLGAPWIIPLAERIILHLEKLASQPRREPRGRKWAVHFLSRQQMHQKRRCSFILFARFEGGAGSLLKEAGGAVPLTASTNWRESRVHVFLSAQRIRVHSSGLILFARIL